MGDMDDEPGQIPLEEAIVEQTIINWLPEKSFDIVITHDPNGEYTRHLRHEEVSKAVINMWVAGKISTQKLWTFAYSDNNREYLPKPIENSSVYLTLPKKVWKLKYNLITKTYGFKKDSWEAQTTPKAEAFREFTDPSEAARWLGSIAQLRVLGSRV